MGVNGYQGQIRAADQSNGYFEKDVELFTLIQNLASIDVGYIKRIGIQLNPITKGETTQDLQQYNAIDGSTQYTIQLPKNTTVLTPTQVRINNEIIQIGKTGIYEANDVEITSIQFVENSPKNTIIDFIIQEAIS